MVLEDPLRVARKARLASLIPHGKLLLPWQSLAAPPGHSRTPVGVFAGEVGIALRLFGGELLLPLREPRPLVGLDLFERLGPLSLAVDPWQREPDFRRHEPPIALADARRPVNEVG